MPLDHDGPKKRQEEVDVERLLQQLDRNPGDLQRGIPDFTYTHEDERWFVEITFASAIAKHLWQSFRVRLEREPWSRTTPSTSAAQFDGLDFEVDTFVSEFALTEAIRIALLAKGEMRYGNEARTHLLIDASGQRVQDLGTARRVVASCPLPARYPYAGVFVVFSMVDWLRPVLELARAD